MNYVYFYGGNKEFPTKCQTCQASLSEVESPFLICSQCGSLVIIANEAPPKENKFIWHELSHILSALHFEKGAIIGLDTGKTFIYLLMRMPWLTLIGIDTPEVSKELQKALYKANLPFSERAFLFFTGFEQTAANIPDESLDFIFIDLKSEDAIENLLSIYQPRLKPHAYIFLKMTHKNITLPSGFQNLTKISSNIIGTSQHPKMIKDPNYGLQVVKNIRLHRSPEKAYKLIQGFTLETTDAYIEKAYCAFSNGKLFEGKELLDQARKKNPQKEEVRYLEAEISDYENDNERAISIMEKLTSDCPSIKNFGYLGRLYRQGNNMAKLKTLTEKLTQQSSDLPLYYYLLGSFYLDLEKSKQSKEIYAKGIALDPMKSLHPTKERITDRIICIKVGNKYGPEYVNKLYHACETWCSFRHHFICLTDNIEGLNKNIEVIPLPNSPLEGWWNKIFLFSPDILGSTKPHLYIDLDEVIIDWIDPYFYFDNPIIALQDWMDMSYNTSVMLFQPQKTAHIFHSFYQKICENFHGDQDWVSQCVQFMPKFPKSWSVSYRLQATFLPPIGSKIVCFHGDPKPHEYPSNWIKKYWV